MDQIIRQDLILFCFEKGTEEDRKIRITPTANRAIQRRSMSFNTQVVGCPRDLVKSCGFSSEGIRGQASNEVVVLMRWK